MSKGDMPILAGWLNTLHKVTQPLLQGQEWNPGLLVLCPELIPIPQTDWASPSNCQEEGHSKLSSSSQELLSPVPSLQVLDISPTDCPFLCFRAVLGKKLAASVNLLPEASSL